MYYYFKDWDKQLRKSLDTIDIIAKKLRLKKLQKKEAQGYYKKVIESLDKQLSIVKQEEIRLTKMRSKLTLGSDESTKVSAEIRQQGDQYCLLYGQRSRMFSEAGDIFYLSQQIAQFPGADQLPQLTEEEIISRRQKIEGSMKACSDAIQELMQYKHPGSKLMFYYNEAGKQSIQYVYEKLPALLGDFSAYSIF